MLYVDRNCPTSTRSVSGSYGCLQQRLVHGERNHVGVADRVSVGRRTHNHLGSYRLRPSRPVIDNDLLAHLFNELDAKNPRHESGEPPAAEEIMRRIGRQDIGRSGARQRNGCISATAEAR